MQKARINYCAQLQKVALLLLLVLLNCPTTLSVHILSITITSFPPNLQGEHQLSKHGNMAYVGPAGAR